MTEGPTFSHEKFAALPVIAILRGESADTCLRVTEALEDTGFRTVEVTMNTPDADKIIHTLRQAFPEMNVGAGTVCTEHDLETALQAGAQFLVTPILNEAVVRTCVDLNLPVFPGAYSPTEIYRAWELGATAVKVFPAGQLGVRYLKDIRGPLPQIKLVPTGGVGKENIAKFLTAGAYGVGMGSSLLNRQLIAREDYVRLRQHFADIRHRAEGALNAH